MTETVLKVFPSAAEPYDALAASYDVLTRDYCHDRWLAEIEQLAIAHGLAGKRLLDVACGTGKSFLPLMQRGYAVTACDLSAQMAAIAQAKAPSANVQVADMRAPGPLGEFDLITCLDDAVNYLLSEGELEAFFDGVARNLAPDGVAVFDVNSLKMYREGFAADWVCDTPDTLLAWTAPVATHTSAGDLVRATIHIFSADGERWLRRASHHTQHHWPRSELTRVAQAATLRIAAVYGQHRGAILDPEFDESVHTKALYFASQAERR